ncbi:substrate-binding domain-containing protein [Occultella gossypii]|uniref:DeoR/GlpR family transcriptional regulator n=1 Tax=Occultella gossypii TaxID=2800820 RepID=A0ABS7SEL5_9MICO|nr:substrate-binding domain-containing protein [Occultella gossypii]MBZ2197741.1 DeoR/GlpR family transcriptional regulator [Occultella gossypii]
MDDDSADGPSVLLPEERRERLIALLQDGATHRINTLAVRLGVTAVTVRRDVGLLADEGQVHRVRGGVRQVRMAAEAGRRPADPSGLVLGMVVPTLRHNYWPEVARGATAAAEEHGATIALRGSTYEQAEYRKDVEGLLETTHVDGLVLAPDPRVAQPDLGEWLASLGVPVVLAERQFEVGRYAQPIEAASTDHELGGVLAARYLHARGHRRIALMVSDSVTASPLRQGWQAACEELGLSIEDAPDATIRVYADAGWRPALDEFIEQMRTCATTAVLVHPDDDALELVGRCAELGIRVPDDLSVISYNDEVANLASPAITAMSPPKAMIGRYAVELMLSRLAPGGSDLPVRRVMLTPVLNERASTARV